MIIYNATARVRIRGALGLFYVREFLVEAHQGEGVADAWLRAFGADWELERITGAEIVAGGAP